MGVPTLMVILSASSVAILVLKNNLNTKSFIKKINLSDEAGSEGDKISSEDLINKIASTDVLGPSKSSSEDEIKTLEMSYTVEALTDPVTLGEGPHWDHDAQALYFVSIFDKTIHKYVPSTKTHTKAGLPEMPTFIIPISGKPNAFAVSQGRKLVEVEWDGEGEAKIIRNISEVDSRNPTNRFNDAKCDPRGRLFAGTMGHEYKPGKFYPKRGSLYRFTADGQPNVVVEQVDISNGLCWDTNEKAFYFADSFEYTIRKYNYDVDTGNISEIYDNVFSYKKNNLEGIVDGMTIDTDGNLWIANFDGSAILKVDPRKGELLEKIPMPALQITSCTWGGPNLDELYVTSASMNRGEEQKPPCGATFRLTHLGARGKRNVPLKLSIK